MMYQNGQTWGDIVFPGSNDIEAFTVAHVHYPEESLFSLLLLAETVHAASNRVFIADRLEVKLQPTKLRLFGLLASLSSLNVADDHFNEFFFSSKISRHFFLTITCHRWRKNTPNQIRAFWEGKTALDVATPFLTYVGGSSFA